MAKGGGGTRGDKQPAIPEGNYDHFTGGGNQNVRSVVTSDTSVSTPKLIIFSMNNICTS